MMTLSDVQPTVAWVQRVVTSTNLRPVIVEVARFAESFGLCEGMKDQRRQAFTKVCRQGASVNITVFNHLHSVGSALMLLNMLTEICRAIRQ
jgi:hypothetical protein